MKPHCQGQKGLIPSSHFPQFAVLLLVACALALASAQYIATYPRAAVVSPYVSTLGYRAVAPVAAYSAYRPAVVYG